MTCSRKLCILALCMFVSLVTATKITPMSHLAPVLETRAVLTTDPAGLITCEVVFQDEVQDHRGLDTSNPGHVIATSSPLIHDESHGDHDEEAHSHSGFEPMLYRVFSRDPKAIKEHLVQKCDKIYDAAAPQTDVGADEVFALVKSGEPSNRIDVVLMGDGYTASERQKFIDDMTRMVADMFRDVTFASYLPVFNVWALFRASVQSGIGVNSIPKNTAFGLYRDGTELRGIYCSKPNDARSACRALGTYGCDFPSIIGNDPFYGGLGGEFTISTSSNTTGTIVLRHEMGHNFGNVGEEYDGGQVYSGANSASSLTQVPQKWSAWLSNPTVPVVAEQSVQRLQSYAWYNLASGPLRLTFTSDGAWSKAYLIFSASGCETDDALIVTLDGVTLPWKSTKTLDRQFYPYIWEVGFGAGSHVLQFTGRAPRVNQIRQVCNVNLHEYKSENLFHFDNNYIGAYPTWSQSNRVTYRPMNERCLMRNMTSDRFCAVCQENNWLQFLNRMSLIDFVEILNQPDNGVQITLVAVPVAQLRPVPIPGEKYSVTWTQNGAVVPHLQDAFSFALPLNQAKGTWNVELIFTTPEVRYDPNRLLTARVTFTV